MSSAALDRRAPYEVRAHHKRCGKCGKLVSRAAFVCRRCGTRQRIKPRTILLVVSACLLAAMFAVAGGGLLFAHSQVPEMATAAAPNPAAAVPGTLAPPDATGAMRVTAPEIWMAYVRDQVAADRKFKDRSLLISGSVRSIERDYEGRPVVRLATGDPYDAVNAKLATRSDPTSSGVRKGDAVTLLCVGRGSLIGSPQLTGCFLR